MLFNIFFDNLGYPYHHLWHRVPVQRGVERRVQSLLNRMATNSFILSFSNSSKIHSSFKRTKSQPQWFGYLNLIWWYLFVFTLFLVSTEKTYQTLEIVINHISYQFKVRQEQVKHGLVSPVWYISESHKVTVISYLKFSCISSFFGRLMNSGQFVHCNSQVMRGNLSISTHQGFHHCLMQKHILVLDKNKVIVIIFDY